MITNKLLNKIPPVVVLRDFPILYLRYLWSRSDIRLCSSETRCIGRCGDALGSSVIYFDVSSQSSASVWLMDILPLRRQGFRCVPDNNLAAAVSKVRPQSLTILPDTSAFSRTSNI